MGVVRENKPERKDCIMRKKSHISLARYIVDSLEDEELRKHKFAFYLGSILPDIKPSFVYRRHEINGTFPDLRRHIARLSEGAKATEKTGRKYYVDLGQISHYLADYFTFPHNRNYPGTLKEHCSYEEKLKKDLRRYLNSGRVKQQEERTEQFLSADALCNFIQKAHDDYIDSKHGVEDDICHIVDVNRKALLGMRELLARRRAAIAGQH